MAGFEHHLVALLEQYGTIGLFLTIALESLGAPVPGESALILASGIAATGKLDIRAVALAAFLGAVLGDNIGYLIGRRLGRAAVLKGGARFGITEAALARTEAVARRWGPLMVIAARFVILLRQLNGIVAGTSGMPWPQFLAANVAGSGLWVLLWTTLAYRFGHDSRIVPFFWHHLSLVAMLLVPLVLGLLFVLHRRRHAG